MPRHRFEAYLDKVFDFSTLVRSLPEGRKSPQHPWPKVFDAVFLGAAAQMPSLLQIEQECGHGVLSKRIGPLSADTMGYALQRQSPEAVFGLGCDIARRLKRNGVLRSDWSRGLVVAAVDGIEICSSFVRCCEACLQREVQHKVRGELRTDVQFYHRLVAAVIVSTPFPVPLGVCFQKPGEGEVSCALRLLQQLVGSLGRRFADLLVGDAIYLQAPFVREIERLGLDWAFTLKENQPELLNEARLFTERPPDTVESDSRQRLECWHLPQADWAAADRQVCVVKTARTMHKREVTVPVASPRPETSRTAIDEESVNFYATSLELGSVPPTFVHQLGRSRWRIDAEVFQTLTTDCHLKHPAVHRSTALVVLTMIRVLAYTLTMVFYCRQVLSRGHGTAASFRQLARLLGIWFVSPGFNTS